MVGFDLPEEKKEVRSRLLFKHFIFTVNKTQYDPSPALADAEKRRSGMLIASLKEELS